MFTHTITSTLVTTYTYNVANQLVTAKLNTSATTWYYEFDARGNRMQVPNGLTPANGEIRYTFNQANQLIRIEKHNGVSYQTRPQPYMMAMATGGRPKPIWPVFRLQILMLWMYCGMGCRSPCKIV